MQKEIFDPNYRRLVQHLLDTRRSLGLSRKQVAAGLGVYWTWVAKVETCEIGLNLIGLLNLCRVYNLDPAQLIKNLYGQRQ